VRRAVEGVPRRPEVLAPLAVPPALATAAPDVPVVSFVIPVRNDAVRLRRCLETIADNVFPGDRVEVIVADNGSTDGSDRVAREAGAVVLSLPGLRVGALRNRAARAARGDILAFVDADHEIDRRWIASAVDAFAQQPWVGAVGALCHAPADGTWVERAYDAFRDHAPESREVHWLGSGNLAVRRKAFEEVGGFDESLEACEDVDLCRRLRARGHRIVADERLWNVHLGDPRTLDELFRKELWRARGNLKVSLRGPLALRDLPSVVIPVLQLGLAVALVVGIAAAPLGALPVAAVAAMSIVGLSGLRAARMLRRTGARSPGRVLRFFAVALVYDLARALGLVARAQHHGGAPATPRAAVRRPIRVLELRSVRGTGGGPEKTILVGAKRTDPARYAVTVCYLRDLRDPVFAIDERAGRVGGLDYVEVRERHSFDPAIWPALRRLVRERDIDIVHAHDYKTNLLALLLSRSDGVIPLSTVHGWTGRSRKERIYYAVDRRVLAWFPALIAVSSEIRAELVAAGAAPDRVRVVLNGIDDRAFRRERARAPGIRSALGLASGEVAIGSVARLAPEKRFDVLLGAFAALRKERPELRLLIAGDGPARADLERTAASLGVADACRFLGNRPDVIDLHHAFDLFVQSSEYEGTPNTVLEAMALETPIIATDVGGTGELVRHEVEGLLVQRGDADAIVRAVRRAIGEPEATARRVAAARARVENELSFDARMRAVEAVYEELAAAAGRRRRTRRRRRA